MSMTLGQHYMYGFLTRCAEENLTPEETEQRAKVAMQKQASIGGSVLNLLASLPAAALVVGGLGSMTLGAGGGLAAAKAVQSDVDEGDLRKQELLSQLQLSTQRLNAIAKQQRNQNAKPPAFHVV